MTTVTAIFTRKVSNNKEVWFMTKNGVSCGLKEVPWSIGMIVSKMSNSFQYLEPSLFDSNGNPLTIGDVYVRINNGPVKVHCVINYWLSFGVSYLTPISMWSYIKNYFTNIQNDFCYNNIFRNPVFRKRVKREQREEVFTSKMVLLLKAWPYVGRICKDVSSFLPTTPKDSKCVRWFEKLPNCKFDASRDYNGFGLFPIPYATP